MRTLMLSVALLLPCAAQAADAVCDFAPPLPTLQAKAYPGQSFVRKKQNNATESALLGKDVRLEILHAQCVDTLVKEYTIILPRPSGEEHGITYWLDYAESELARLKTSKDARDIPGLLAFLKHAHDIKPRGGALLACKDGSEPVGEECDWESLGGYVFKVNTTRTAVRIAITDYTSG